MVLLTFSVLLPKLEDLSKQQTVRGNVDYWRTHWRRKNRTLHIWWKNPRNQAPDCHRIGVADWAQFLVLPGHCFTQDIAERDGFNDVEALIRALADKHDMAPALVLQKEWAILRWEWLSGPERSAEAGSL